MKKNLLKLTAFASVAAICGFTNAQAAMPKVSGEAVFELQLEHGANSDNAGNERTNTFGRVEVAPKVEFNENIFIDGVAVLEPVQDLPAGDDGFFDDEGIFIEEIKLNFEKDNFGVFVGKFNPAFGTAWDARGVWGEDFAEDYEVTEKIGFGGSYTVETATAGNHTVSASTFFADTSFLTHSTVTGRGDVDKADGGVSNTEDFSSYAVALDGENVGGLENLSYHLGFRSLAAGDADAAGTKDDKAFAIGANYVIPFNKNFNSDILVEYVVQQNVDGGANDKTYLTASVVNTINENWNITASYTKRDEDVSGGADVNDHLFQLTGGYDFGNGLTLQAGWRNSEESNEETDIIGGLARYTMEF